MSELTSSIRAALADAGTRQLPASGYGAVFRPLTGPLSDHIITVHRGGRDPEVQETLARRHEAYIDCLRLAGISVPETRMRLLDDAGIQHPVIVQEAMRDNVMLPMLIEKAGPNAALGLLDRVATDIAEFWRRIAQRPERIGLNIRPDRLAMTETGLIYLDTFPPLISYSRNEMGQVIQRFADSGLIRELGKILPGRIRDIQNRWYTPAGSVTALVDGALRLRSQDAQEILAWADRFADTRLEVPWRDMVRIHLAKQAKHDISLSRGWQGFGGRDRPHA